MSEPTCMTFREVGLTCGGWNSLAVRLAEAEARLAEAEKWRDYYRAKWLGDRAVPQPEPPDSASAVQP